MWNERKINKMISYVIADVKKRLIEAGVDISIPNYVETEAFIPFKTEYYLGGPEGRITIQEIIERYILTDEQVKNVYLSNYEMGNRVLLTEEECQYIRLAKELDRFNSHKLGVDAKEFYRKNGLRDRIKKYFGIDLDLYRDINDPAYQKNTSEVFKILFLLYHLENIRYSDRNILKMLGNPSIENVDNSMVGIRTSNGSIMKDLKDCVEREISVEYRGLVKTTLYKIVTDWEQMIVHLTEITNYFDEMECQDDLIKILSKYNELIRMLHINEMPLKYNHSPAELLYLKLCQHEQLGRVKDIIFVNSIETKNIARTKHQIEKLRKLRKCTFRKEDASKYVKSNYKNIAELVYLREDISEKETNLLLSLTGKLELILNFFNTQTKLFWITGDTIDSLFVVSCLQAIVLSDQNEKFNYKFPAYDRVSKTPKSVQNALNSSENEIFEALKIYFVRKVMECWNYNLGHEYCKEHITAFENICDTILCNLLLIPDINDMKFAHDYLVKQIGHDILEYPQKIEAKNYFTVKLSEMGYQYIDPDNIIGDLFLESDVLTENLDKLLGNIENKIKDSSEPLGFELSYVYEVCFTDGYPIGERHLELVLDKQRHIVKPTESIKPIQYKKDYIDRLKKIGISVTKEFFVTYK